MVGCFGLCDDHHHTRVPHDLIVEANPRLDVWMLLQCGGLAENATTRLQWGEKTYLLARRTPDIWIDGTRVPVTWDEPMPGVGRPWFECRRAVDVAGTRTYGRRSLAGDVTVFSMQFDTCGGRCQASSAVAMCGRSRRYRHAGEAAAALITTSSSR